MRIYAIAFLSSLLAGVIGVYFFLKWQDYAFKTPALDRISQIKQWEQAGVPDFTFKNPESKQEVSLKNYEGRIVLVHFWASWCGPCVEEIPSLFKLAQQLGDKIQILAFSVDSNLEAMESFLAEHRVQSLPNLLYVFDEDPKISELFQVDRLPESYIVGPDLKLKRRITGAIEWVTPESLSYFEALLAGTSQ